MILALKNFPVAQTQSGRLAETAVSCCASGTDLCLIAAELTRPA